jgi:signal transduction histidine kinase
MTALETSKLFASLSPAQCEQLRKMTQTRSFAPHQQIFKEGDPGDGLYVVKTGKVQISGLLNGEKRHVFAHAMPGEVFGEMAVLDQRPRSASATAEVDSEVYFIPRDPMLEVIQQSAPLALWFLQEISHRLREFNRQYVREVLQAERMALVGRFASAIVHDLKNPLTIIQMATEMVCLEGVTAESRRLARERVGKQVERITSLVNDILEFTRGTPVEMALPVANYGAYVQELLSDIATEIAPKNVSLQFASPPPPVRVALHPKRLSRVFYNLIGNAVDAMPKGGKITLRFEVTATEVITEVQDTGPGIPPEIAPRLFETFATFGKKSGTGLGLSIVQRIVEEHGGKITARNLPPGGAAFTFRLPLR